MSNSFRAFDSEKMFADAVSMASGFTTGASPYLSSSVDMGIPDADDTSDPQVALCVDGPTSAGGNTGVLTVSLQDSADNSSFATILTAAASAANAANYAIGTPFRMAIPPKHRRYLRLSIAITTQSFSAGTLHAGVV